MASGIFTVRGGEAAAAEVDAIHFAVESGGAIARHLPDGWHRITAAATVPLDAWSTVRVAATTTRALFTS